jgi:hypothetical protein
LHLNNIFAVRDADLLDLGRVLAHYGL